MIDSGCLVPVGRQKIPPRALVGGDLSEDVDEPCADVDTDGLAGGDKGVCDGGPDSGGVIAGEEIVFPAEPTGVYRTAGRCSSTATGDIDSSAVSSYAACPEAILSGYSQRFSNGIVDKIIDALFHCKFNRFFSLSLDKKAKYAMMFPDF